MRILFILVLLFSFPGFAQVPRELQPKNSIAISDSSFIGQTEITNAMYREFVYAIRDSIVTHYVYANLEDIPASAYLNVSKKQLKKINPTLRDENMLTYGLNYDHYKDQLLSGDDDFLMLFTELCYSNPERFYKRRELDNRKFLYTMNGHKIAVMPDTLSWINDYYVKYESDSSKYTYNWASSFKNMYFWHPAYDNFPVVGLNFDQIMAYCHWYSRQLNKNSNNPGIQYSVTLPTIEDYQKALKMCAPAIIRDQINPESAYDLIVYQRESKDAYPFIHKVYSDFATFEIQDSAALYKTEQWAKTNSTSPILNLLGGPAEIIVNTKEPEYMAALGGDYYLGILDPNGVQENTLFYERLIYKNQGYSFLSFRVLVTICAR